jgi:hypothetical protein
MNLSGPFKARINSFGRYAANLGIEIYSHGLFNPALLAARLPYKIVSQTPNAASANPARLPTKESTHISAELFRRDFWTRPIANRLF